ncbi:MAG: choice-of-anchor J domain-containing protein [Saprospiraceae bacterium]|nr:choice-of-anchor J domain-containing protein [Saprospiraceae bacterium]
MRKNLLVILFCSLFSAAFAQIKYSQDFENGFGDMVLIDVDKKAPHAQVASYTAAWNIRTSDGSKWAVSNSWYDPAGKADDWMITPVITDITANTVLTWRAFSADAQYKDSYEVRVSATGGTTPADFNKVLFTKAGENGDPIERSLSLKDYAGQQVRLAFRNISNDKFLLFIDDIQVFDAVQRDASLTDATVKKYVLKGNEAIISYSFKNYGLSTINSIDIEWTDGVESHVDERTGINVKFFETYYGQFKTKVAVDEPEQINIKARVLKINGLVDSVAVNNERSLVIHGLDKDIPQKMVVEEGTGTWCGWCPRGAVNMAKMRDTYSDEFIGIAVHNEDPMMSDEYNAGITSIPGFSGFPSVVINRASVQDPGDLEDILLNTVRNETGPAAIEVNSSITDRTITVEANIDFNTQFINEDLRLIAVLVEDSVVGTGSGYDQVNFYANVAAGIMGGYESLPNPVPASQMVYNEVGRELLFGFDGRANAFGTEINSGDFADLSFDFDVSPSYDINNLFVVVMIADGEGNILAADHSESRTVGSNEVSNKFTGVKLSPNPSQGGMSYLTVSLTESQPVSISVVNQLGQMVASRDYGILSGEMVLPISTMEFGKGLYFVNLNAGNKLHVSKLMVD